MSEKLRSNHESRRSPEASKAELKALLDEMNNIRAFKGQPRGRLVDLEGTPVDMSEVDSTMEPEFTPEEAFEVDQAREIEIAEAMDREAEQARAFEVQKIMAEEATAREMEKARSPINDPDMREITLRDLEETEKAEDLGSTRELNIIGGAIRSRESADSKAEAIALAKEFDELQKEKAELRKILESEASEPGGTGPNGPKPNPTAPNGAKPKAAESEELEPEDGIEPLFAASVDWSKSEEKLAKKLAKKDLKRELKGASLIKKIWKGKLFRDYYKEKYTDEYLNGVRTDKNGKTIAEAIEEQKQELVADFVREARQADREDWNKNGFRTKSGDKLIPVEKETSDKIRSTIEDYARFMVEFSEIRPKEARDPQFIKEVDRRFNNYMNQILDKAIKEGKINSDVRANNYLEVAKEAAIRYQGAAENANNKVEQDAAMARVMAGFQVYNIVSTKAFTTKHQSYIDKILDEVDSDKVDQCCVPDDALSKAIDEMNDIPVGTAEDSYESWDSEIKSEIASKKDIIGDEGVSIMIDPTPYSVCSKERYSKWWNALSDDGKQTVRELVKEISSSKYASDAAKWGNGFRIWLIIHDK